MKRLLILALGLCSVATTGLRAENIDWAAVFGNIIRNENNAPSAVGNAVLLGHFGANGAPTPGQFFFDNQSFAQLFAGFTQYDSAAIGAGGNGPGEFFDQTGNVALPGAAGDQLYMWVFNSATPATATAWAIITSAAWVRPATGANTTAFDVADGFTVPAGALGRMVSDGFGGFDVGMSTTIPEPSTYILGAAASAVFVAFRRRNRR